MKLEHVDSEKSFDWSKSSEYYAKYRDIYPKEFYQILSALGIGKKGQKILDLCTGTLLLDNEETKEFAEGDVVRFAEGDINGITNLSNEEFVYISVTSPPINFRYAYKVEK